MPSDKLGPARQLVPSPADVSSMRARRTNALLSMLASLAGLCGVVLLRCSGEPRRGRAATAALRSSSRSRPADRCDGRAFRDGGHPRPVQRRWARGHHQYRQRIAGRHCARRGRRQRFRTGRYQRAGALSRQGQAGRAAGQGGVRAVQQGALRHRRPAKKPRHPVAVGYGRKKTSASPRAIFRSGCGRGGETETASSSPASSKAASAPRCAIRCCRRGSIDAVTGFSYRSAINLKDRGRWPADDLAVLKFARLWLRGLWFLL